MSESIKFGNKQLPSFRELTKHLDGDRSSFNTQAVPTRIMLFPRHYSLESLPRPYVFSPHHKSPRTNNYLPKLSISSSINMNSGPGSPSSSSPKSLPRPPKVFDSPPSAAESIESSVSDNTGEFVNCVLSILDLRRRIHFDLTTIDKQFHYLIKKKSKSLGLIEAGVGDDGKPKYISKSDLMSLANSIPCESITTNIKQAIQDVGMLDKIRLAWKEEHGKQKQSKTVHSKGHFRNKSSPGRIEDYQIKKGKKRKVFKLAAPIRGLTMSPSGEVVDVAINPKRLHANAKSVEAIQNPMDNVNGGLNCELSVVAEDLKCNHCGSSSSPEWRRGPDGKRTLCNACGLFYSKLARKFGKDHATLVMLERKKMGANNNRSLNA